MEMRWSKEVLVNIGDYQNVRIVRELTFTDNDDAQSRASAIFSMEQEIADEVLKLKPAKLNGMFNNAQEFDEAQIMLRKDILKKYGLAHTVTKTEY